MPGNQLGHVIGQPAFEGGDGHAGESARCIRFGVHRCDGNTRPALSVGNNDRCSLLLRARRYLAIVMGNVGVLEISVTVK